MTWLLAADPDRVATKEDLAEVRTELRADIAQVRLDSARQTRQLTLTILGALLAQLAGTSAVIASVV